jgi:hypothetical protein
MAKGVGCENVCRVKHTSTSVAKLIQHSQMNSHFGNLSVMMFQIFETRFDPQNLVKIVEKVFKSIYPKWGHLYLILKSKVQVMVKRMVTNKTRNSTPNY